jgi:nucleotide-binding universal stress UspA family protein
MAVIDPASVDLRKTVEALDQGAHQRPGVPQALLSSTAESLVEHARRYLDDRASKIRAQGVEVSTTVGIGAPAEEIPRSAIAFGADVIAMATRRERTFLASVRGSVSDRVLQSSIVPVLTMNPTGMAGDDTRSNGPDIIVVPLDGSKLSEHAVPVALNVADRCLSNLLFLRAVRVPHYLVGTSGMGYHPLEFGVPEEKQEAEDYLRIFAGMAAVRGLHSEIRVVVGEPAARIIEQTKHEPNAMIVMSTRGIGGLKRWVLGSVTDRVISLSGHPVLVVPPSVIPEFDPCDVP